LRIAALRGDAAETDDRIAAVTRDMAGSSAFAVKAAAWAAATLYNGLARYDEALAAANAHTGRWPWMSLWVIPELVEAAARTGQPELARDALGHLIESTQACRTNWALGIESRCRALLAEDADAERLYLQAIDALSRTKLRPETARAHLLYGEWLRRQGRRIDAREQLAAAHTILADIGMHAFADRARRELLATGAKLSKHNDESTRHTLTPQERQISLLARDGFSNPEIAAQLFLSPRTVEWHMRKIFAKLSVSSRRQLRDIASLAG
jgi:ATP/maltotriose-dependent transcriptional regulator MalT